MEIRFTRDVWLKKDDRAGAPSFPEGSLHDMNKASAHRWVRRSVAVYIVEEAVESPKLKMDRPMMEKRTFKHSEVADVFSVGDVKEFTEAMGKVDLVGVGKMAAEADKPKKRGRKSKGV